MLNGRNGAEHARVVRAQESGARNQQQAGIELIAAIDLHEGIQTLVETLLQDLHPQRLPVLPPGLQIAFHPIGLGVGDAAVQRAPRHDLGEDEGLAAAAHLPDTVIGIAPDLTEVVGEGPLHPPAGGQVGKTQAAAFRQNRHDLAIDIELNLLRCGVADPHRGGIGIARQPGRFPLRQPPLAADAIHDLDLVRHPGNRPQQPVPPGFRLGQIPGAQESTQGQRRVTQPAETIIPVPVAAELLRQRCGGGRHNAAGGRIGQRLEGEQRAFDGGGPFALVNGRTRPIGPELLGAVIFRLEVRPFGRIEMRRVMDQGEHLPLAGAQRETHGGRQMVVEQLDGGKQADPVRPADALDTRIVR